MGNFDRFVASDLQKYMKSPDEMKAGFKATLPRTKPSPGPKYVMLGEYTVHGEDIRRALGRRGDHPAERLQALAEMYAATKAPIDGKRRTEGLSFRATDGDWSIGEGQEVAGPGNRPRAGDQRTRGRLRDPRRTRARDAEVVLEPVGFSAWRRTRRRRRRDRGTRRSG